MATRFISADLFGIEGRAIEVQVDCLRGLSGFNFSGMAGPRVKESPNRIRSAIQNSGLSFPGNMRVIVNLVPANLPKDGSGFDLPIALAILDSCRLIDSHLARVGVLGELSLEGEVLRVDGVVGRVGALKREGIERVILPIENLQEARVIKGIDSIGVHTLSEAVAVLRGETCGVIAEPIDLPQADDEVDFAEVIGHEEIKRALALAVAGGHNVLLVGPPGSGKSFLARRMGTLLPPLPDEEALEVLEIRSAAGLRPELRHFRQRPFRAPHHTVSWAGLVGGGNTPRPGEITLAHRGVLFLDELPEFPRRSLEALREPLEEGRIAITRSQFSVLFPAQFLLIAAMNPCPCGQHRNPKKICHCPIEKVRRYLSRISGPLLDRIDLRLEVNTAAADFISAEPLWNQPPGSSLSSAQMREIVAMATAFRHERGQEYPNRQLEWAKRGEWAPLGRNVRTLFSNTAEELDLSARALNRLLRLARTVADADASLKIEEKHLLEALKYYTPKGGQDYLGLLQSL